MSDFRFAATRFAFNESEKTYVGFMRSLAQYNFHPLRNRVVIYFDAIKSMAFELMAVLSHMGSNLIVHWEFISPCGHRLLIKNDIHTYS